MGLPTRRSVLASGLVTLTAPALANPANAIHVAIRRAALADAACREAGQRAIRAFGPVTPRPAFWRAYRAGLALERYEARRALHALTPITSDEASALVVYYAERVMLTANPGAAKAARRRLRKVFARPGAVPAPALPAVLRPPAPS